MRKVLKVFLYILGGIFVLLIGVIIWLNTPYGKNFVRARVVAFLRGKLKTEVYINELGYGLPKYVVLKGVLFKDQAKDTLLAVQELKIDLDMLKLIHKQVDVQQLLLNGVHAHVYRNAPDTDFNFSYIITAFTGKKDTTKKKDTSSSSMSIDLNRVVFKDIHIRFNDYTGGMQLGLDLQSLDLKMKKLDLDKMLFHIKELSIAGLQTTYKQDTSLLPPKIDTTKTQSKLQLIADNISLQHIGVQYNDNLNKFLFALNMAGLNVQLNNFDLNSHIVDIKKIALDTTTIKIVMGKNTKAPAPVDTIVKVDTTQGWRVLASDLKLAGVNFIMDNENSPRQPSGIDYSHLNVQNLALNAEGVLYSSDTISGNLKHLSAKEQSGLDLKELRTNFLYCQQGATLRNLYLLTSNTVLQDYLEVKYPSLDALKTRMQSMQLRINLKKSIIGLKDVLVFVPSLQKQDLFRKYSNGHLQLEATMQGFLNSLNISHFYLAGMDNTEVLLNGRVSGLPDANKLNYNLHIARLQSSRSDITALLPPKTLTQIRLPDRFGISGELAGTEKDYNTNLLMVSSDGVAYLKGYVFMSPGKNRERYDLFVNTQRLNLGHILEKDSLMGPITASFKVVGHSFDINTMTASLNGSIQSAMLKGYNYHEVNVNGKVASKIGDINLTSADTNIRITLNSHADLSGKYPAVKADLKIDSINLQALKLYSSEFRMRGIIHLDFPVLNPDYPQGSFVFYKPTITANGKRYFLDSMYIIAQSSADSGQNIKADFDVMQATITGKTPLTKIGDIIQDNINRHYSFPVRDSAKKVIALAKKQKQATIDSLHPKNIPSDYNLNMVANVEDKPLLHSILPGLTSFDSIHIDASISRPLLTLNASMPEIVYGKTTIENGEVYVKGNDSAFTYQLTVDRIAQSEMQLWYANIHGNLDQNTINTNISLSDSAGKERFALAATMHKNGDTQVVQLQPGLKLNYQIWQVQEPNSIALSDKGFYISNFNISNNNQYIKINSDQPRPNAPLKVDISNFLLANITQVISRDTLVANGLLGGNIAIEHIDPSPVINSKLQIKDLSIMNDTIGDSAIEVNNKQDNALDTKINIQGRGNDVSLTGTYYLQTTNGNDFNFDLNLKALNVQSVEGLTFGSIRNSSGFLRGEIYLQGTTDQPQIKGEVRTDQLATTVSMLNAYFKMPADKITFTNSGLTFNDFEILDSASNKAILNGQINTTDLSNIGMDLQIQTKDWRAIHSTVTDNKNFYGDLLVSTDLNVKGTPSSPNVDGTLNILKGTKLTVVMPEEDPQIQSNQGIVRFFDSRDSDRMAFIKPRKKRDSTKIKLATGANINVNIGIDKQAEFSLIMDQSTGDFLTVRGDAALNANVTPGGTMGLTGTYSLHEGTYQLNYNFIKRRFKIQDGSSITFAGDPTKSIADITAVYEANVAPYDLVQNEVPDQSQLIYYKQRLPFNVELHLNGPVMTPRITFNVVLPDDKLYPISYDAVELVQGKLSQVRQDTSELNKQVFALLILGHFVGDDPFSSGAGTSASTAALQSVSTFIGEQLNQFASNLVKGVDLSVDLATSDDYTTGDLRQRTDLNVAASKRLLNDRLKVTVGNDFELQGPQTSNSDQSNLVPSNLAADYNLSPDGRYVVRAYRKNYDEGVLEGYVTETGVNFIVSLDYNHFKNVFKKKNVKKPMSKDASH